MSVMKMTGLVRSYTLECNYNTGRMVNLLPPCIRDSGRMSVNPAYAVPPKYTPLVFEEVRMILWFEETIINNVFISLNSEFSRWAVHWEFLFWT